MHPTPTAKADGGRKIQILREQRHKVNAAIHAAPFQIRKSLRFFTTLPFQFQKQLKT
jgi:hypothetical protein